VILYHYSHKPELAPRTVPEEDHVTLFRGDKPKGLWLSDDAAEESWPWFCSQDGWPLGRYRFEVTVSDDANILVLDTVDKLLAFSELYNGAEPFPGQPDTGIRSVIDWPQVAEDFQGILISPYQWDLRYDPRTQFYYGWDVASACVWDASAIARVSPA
jgi:hypothetical protein